MSDCPRRGCDQTHARATVRGPGLKVIDVDYGDLIPLADWLQGVETNFFTDYDGHGYWATETGYDETERVFPAQVKRKHQIPPKGATHVFWFNR